LKQVEVDVKKKFPSWVVDASKQGCLNAKYKAAYPSFSEEFMGLDLNRELELKGSLVLKYGAQPNCQSGNTDGHINVNFKYKTRTHLPDAKRDLQGKWYYKKCMESKNSDAWKSRPATAYPFTMECFKTMYDATVARDYY
jgi:hypothetical protein